MEMVVRDLKGIKVVRFFGALDTASSPEAEVGLNELLAQGAAKVLINFEHTDFLTSMGLRVILAAAKQLQRKQGELRVSNLNETLREVFAISGFDTLFQIFPDESEALSGF